MMDITSQQIGQIETHLDAIQTILDEVKVESPVEPPVATGGNYVGLHDLGAVYYGAAAWPQAPVNRMRMWDGWNTVSGVNSWVSWDGMHKAKGRIDWVLFDAWVALAKSKNVTEIIYTFGYTPRWARKDGDRARAPSDLAVWDEFVRAIITRAKATGLAWAFGIWNEPNAWPQESGYFWKDSPTTLAAMGARLYAIKQQVWPESLVISPETQGNGAGWMQSYMAAPGGKDWDILGVHLYGGGANYLNEIKTYYADFRKLTDKPCWNTEYGWEERHGGTCEDYMRAMAHACKDLGIERCYWYAYDTPTGRLANPPTEIKARMDAYREVINL